MKRQTIRYYTESGKYMGWAYVQSKNFSGYRSWLRSGNRLIIGKQVYNSFDVSGLLYVMKNYK